MHSIKKTILFGFLVWLITFAISFVVYPLRDSNRPLFESIMPVVLSMLVALFACLYFRKVDQDFAAEGIKLGLVWFGINIVLDLFLFMWGPMKMSFVAYLGDIGLTYLIILVITIGYGYVLENKIKKS